MEQSCQLQGLGQNLFSFLKIAVSSVRLKIALHQSPKVSSAPLPLPPRTVASAGRAVQASSLLLTTLLSALVARSHTHTPVAVFDSRVSQVEILLVIRWFHEPAALHSQPPPSSPSLLLCHCFLFRSPVHRPIFTHGFLPLWHRAVLDRVHLPSLSPGPPFPRFLHQSVPCG